MNEKTTKEVALKYIELGYKVFPLHSIDQDGNCSCRKADCKSAGKHPRTQNGLSEATNNKSFIDLWFGTMWKNAHIGIATGSASGVFVVDIDTKHDGLGAWENYKDDHGIDDNETIMAKTPSGGYHVYFKAPLDVKINTSTNVLANGIDIRGEGGYVVAYPSKGYEYLIGQSPWDFEADAAPNFLLDTVKKKEIVNAVKQREVEGDVILAPNFVEKIKEALVYFNKEDYSEWFSVGACLHSTGDSRAIDWYDNWSSGASNYSEEGCYKNFAEYDKGKDKERKKTIEWLFNEANKRGWIETHDISDCDFYDISDSDFEVLKRNSGAVRNKLEIVARLDVPCIKQYEGAILHNCDTLAEYDDQFPIDEWWHEGGLFQGANFLIAGEPKIGKSKFFADFATNAALGREFLGAKFSRPLKVAWVQAEIVSKYLNERIQAIKKTVSPEEMELFRTNFLFTSKVDLDVMNAPSMNTLHQIVIDHEIDFICIDPMINVTSAEENDNTEISRMLKRLETLKTTRCPNKHRSLTALGLVHHMKKGVDPDNVIESIRGASAIRGRLDTALCLTKNKAGDIQIDYELRNKVSPKPHLIYFDDSSAVKMKEGGIVDNVIKRDKLSDELASAGLMINQINAYRFVMNYLKDTGRVNLDNLSNMMLDNEVIANADSRLCKRLISQGVDKALSEKINHITADNVGGLVWYEFNNSEEQQ